MNRSHLIDVLSEKFPSLTPQDRQRAVEAIFGAISAALENGDRVEMRGFGNFETRLHKARLGRNPRTGEAVEVEAKCHVHFKASKLLLRKMNTKSSAP